MSISMKQEYALLSVDEIALIRSTHHPEIYDLERKDLVATQARLRDLHSKAKTVTRHKQREARGKAEPRGKAFPGTADQPQKKKQVFAAALKRVNRELRRLDQFDAKVSHVAAAQKALAERRAANFAAPVPASRKSGEGMAANESTRRRRILKPAKIGSVLKQNKVAQAIRDTRSR